MSKRFAGIALTLALLVPGANAETLGHVNYVDSRARIILFGDSGWELFRPECREQTFSDLAYLTYDLRSERAGLGLRFHSSSHLSIDLQIDPLTQKHDLVGPVYDFDIGATILALRISF